MKGFILGALLFVAAVATGAILTWVALGVGVVGPEQAPDPSDSPSEERAKPEESAR